MLVSEAFIQINYALRAVDDDVPQSSSDEGKYWLATLNRKKNELYADTGKNWSTIYSVANLGAITVSATPSFALSATYLATAGQPYAINSIGQRIDLDLIEAEERDGVNQAVFIAGYNPQTLYFNKAITATDQLVGATLYLPGFFLPADMTADTDTLPFPDPYWGVMATAAELAANDLTYEDKAADLNAKANNLYSLMVRKNRSRGYNNSRVTPTNVPRLTSPGR